MHVLLQLSDLHFLADPVEQPSLLDALTTAVARERARLGRVDLLALTGDVFDCADAPAAEATGRFADLFERLREAAGGDVPAILVPGNHDRRRAGLFGPHRGDLFAALRRALPRDAWVHGCGAPFLARVVPRSFHGLPFAVLAYDSTYLPRGYLSAGGMLRQEDLLQAACEIADEPPETPLLMLTHHHLVPTPITDLGAIEAHGAGRWTRFVLTRVLPRLVAHADREELTMTALGAGTALSTLHTLGRPVLVLHGHKHYATARLLDGIGEQQGDVLVVSAGSAGTAQAWAPTPSRETARLWPSFNVVRFDGDRLEVETASFGWKGANKGELVHRLLVRARRVDREWIREPVTLSETEGQEAARFERNESWFDLVPSRRFPGHWDATCTRRLDAIAARRPHRYVETVEAAPGARVFVDHACGRSARPAPAEVELDLEGATRMFVEGLALERRAARRQADDAPFASVGLMNRYRSGAARLELRAPARLLREVFGSATDLGTGLERPVRAQRAEGAAVLEVAPCPPRTLLRLHWPLPA